jgi:hypothetical protein
MRRMFACCSGKPFPAVAAKYLIWIFGTAPFDPFIACSSIQSYHVSDIAEIAKHCHEVTFDDVHVSQMFDTFRTNFYERLSNGRDYLTPPFGHKLLMLIHICQLKCAATDWSITPAINSYLIDTATIAVPYCHISRLSDPSLSPQASLTTIIRRICRDLCFAAHLATLEAAMRGEVEHV